MLLPLPFMLLLDVTVDFVAVDVCRVAGIVKRYCSLFGVGRRCCTVAVAGIVSCHKSPLPLLPLLLLSLADLFRVMLTVAVSVPPLPPAYDILVLLSSPALLQLRQGDNAYIICALSFPASVIASSLQFQKIVFDNFQYFLYCFPAICLFLLTHNLPFLFSATSKYDLIVLFLPLLPLFLEHRSFLLIFSQHPFVSFNTASFSQQFFFFFASCSPFRANYFSCANVIFF